MSNVKREPSKDFAPLCGST